MRLPLRWLQWLLLCLFLGAFLLTLALDAFQLEGANRAVAQTAEGNSIREKYIQRVREVTFSTMPPASESGRVEVPDLGVIEWEAGQTPDEFLKLGAFYDSFNLQLFNLQEIADLSGFDLNSFTLADVSLFSSQTLGDLVEAIPSLGKWQVFQIPLVEDLLSQVFNGASPWDELSLEQVISQGNLKNLVLGDLNLSQYGLDSIPGLEQTPIGRLNNWEQSFIDEIPGLKEVPFAAFPSAPLGAGYVALFDVPYGKKEARRLNTITGSDIEGFKVPCDQDSCSYVELSGPPWLGATALHGKQWIKGGKEPDAQMVRGGHGALALVNGGKEPTGRHPYGRGFKVVLRKTVESQGLAEFAVYFRYCNAFGCTPYFIGPVPWFSNHEDEIIFVGLTQASQPPPNVPSHTGLPSGVKIPGYPPPSAAPDTSNLGNDDCQTYKGVSIGALKQGVAAIESYEGNYTAVGKYVCDRNGLCGRALGKYQFMTYNEQARNRILQKPGGAAFLKRAENPASSNTAISQELLKYFPVNAQEAARSAWFKELIDKASAEGKTGDNLIARIGEMHNAGPEGRSPGYGRRTVQEYKKTRQNVKAVCETKGACSGKLIHPAAGYSITSGYGWRIHPITGRQRFHAGIDYGTPMGTSIKAADGGTVVHSGWMSGYGNSVDIKHCDGRLTRYGHLSRIRVARGPVTQYQVVGEAGSTGNSTGPHLHFEVHVRGTHINPLTQLGR